MLIQALQDTILSIYMYLQNRAHNYKVNLTGLTGLSLCGSLLFPFLSKLGHLRAHLSILVVYISSLHQFIEDLR